MGRIAQLWVTIAADLSDLNKGFSQVEKATATIGDKLGKIGNTLSTHVSLPLLGAGAASIAFAEKLDDAFDDIRVSTGATGTKFEALGASFRNVFGAMPDDANAVAHAIGELHARTGQAGPSLEALAVQALNVSRLMKEDLNGVIESSTRLFGDWGIATGQQAGTMDFLFKAAQQSGAGFAQLSEQLVKFGAPLRQLGFGFEESAALLAKWEKEGVNAELVLGSMRIGLANFAKEGKDAPAAIRQTIESIQGMASASEATALAIKIFGARAGPDMAAAIREGRFSLDELLNLLKRSPEGINAAADSTKGFSEQWKTLANQLMLAIEPIGKGLVDALMALRPQIESAVGWVTRMAQGFADLSPHTQTAIVALSGVAIVLGPLISIVGAFMKAWVALRVVWVAATPVATSLVSAITAISAPVWLGIAAVGAMVAAGKALVDNWKIITFEVKNLVDRIREALVGRFNAIVDSVREKVEAVTGFFRNMYDKVVGHSYVPDMIKGIAAEFAKLDKVMTQPTRKALDELQLHFASAAGKMKPEYEILIGMSGRYAAAIDRLKELKLDLMLETDAKSAKTLRENITELEASIGRMGAALDALAGPRAQLDALVAAAFQLRTELGKLAEIKIPAIPPITNPAIPLGPGANVDRKPPDFTWFETAMLKAVDVINQVIGAFSSTKGFLGMLGSAASQAGSFLLSAGKAVLNAFASIGGKLLAMFNPLTIVTSVFDAALRKAAEKNEKLAAAFDRLVGIVADAFAPVIEALIPVFDALEPVIRELTPIIAAVAEIFAALFKGLAPILHALVPILRAVFPIFKFLAIITTYLGQALGVLAGIVLTVSSWIGKAIGNLIKGLGKALNALLPGNPFNFLVKAGDSLIDWADGFGDAAGEMFKLWDEMAKAREEIKKINLDEPAENVSGAFNSVAKSAGDAAAALGLLAGGPDTSTFRTFAGPTLGTDPGPGFQQIVGEQHFHGVQDPNAMRRQIERRALIERRRGGTSDLQLAVT